MSLYLGMDVGGTHTRAVLVARAGRVAGVGMAASANYHNVGLETARVRLVEAVEAAWRSAGKPVRPASHAFLGSAGVRSRIDEAEIRAVAESAGFAPAGAVTVRNDLWNALAGGLAGRPGIAVIAGTGTNCLGRDEGGRSVLCGGWGWLLDDEGGAFGLAIAALRAVARAADGRGRQTSLQPAALAFFSVAEPEELLARFYARRWTPDEVAAFAPVVARQAADGDAVALGILSHGAAALGALVAGAVRGLKFRRPPQVVLLGGCGRSGAPYQPLIERALAAASPGIRLREPAASPLAGAALNALRCGGVAPVPSLVMGRFPL